MSKRMALAAMTLSVGAVAGAVAPALADTIYVPRDRPTIQSAIDRSGRYDAVVIQAGTYHENVVVSGLEHTGLQIYAEGDVRIEGAGPGAAVTIVDTREVSLFGVHLSSAGDGVLVSSSSGVTVQGVTATDLGGDGLRIDASETVNLVGNFVTGTGGDGISIENSVNIGLDGNDVRGTGESGVEITSTEWVLMFANHVTGTGADGVVVIGGSGVSVCSNSVTDCAGDGISCSDTRNLVLDEDVVEEVEGDAVSVTGSETVGIYNNRFGGADETASGALTLDGTTATVGGDGIRVEDSAYVDIQFNMVTGTAGHGVCVLGSGATIVTNVVTRTGGHGVYLADGAANALVQDNVIQRTGQSGVVVEGSASRVDANRIELAGYDGIVVHGAYTSVTANVVQEPANDGICVMNDASETDVVVEGNAIVRPGDDGVDLGATSGSGVWRNTVTRAGDNGFELVTGAGNVLGGNRARRSHGFDLFEGDGAVNDVDRSNKFKSRNTRHRGRGNRGRR